jgi:hypothetical protein
MNKLSLFLFSIIFGTSLSGVAQITVDGSTFPKAGDILNLETALDPAVSPGPAGTDQFWDFTALAGQPVPFQTVLPASQGSASASFPDADVLIQSGPNIENYFRRTDNEFSLLGFSGPDPLNFGLNLNIRYIDPQLERFAPMSFPDVKIDDAAFRIAIAWDDLPGGLTDSLGNFPILPDSIALKFEFQTIDQVDAWGSLALKDATREVLRVKRTRIQKATVEAKIVAFWIDITDLIQIPLFQQFQQDTTLTYQYYSATDNQPVVSLTMSDDQLTVTQASFLPQGTVSTTTPSTQLATPHITASPNPAIGPVRFQFSNLNSSETYSLRLMTLTGQIVQDIPVPTRDAAPTLTIQTSHLPQGLYLYSLHDASDRPISTKRLVLLRP